ncbi:MAG: shikimate dehydrogenase [Candidatus Omnitrophica bacterium]|nr:shikimate dehydrogenase [Candidatus Omnitrophota bacterium]
MTVLKKRIYGLIGLPLKHSLSALMHNAAFKTLKINAEYRLFEIRPEEVDNFLAHLDENNISGLNVTIPYKEKVLKFVKLDQESSFLRQLQAVNTIAKRDGLWTGFNTDIAGFSRHLNEQFDPLGKKAAILGAGGAAKAVAYVLASLKAKSISVFDVDRQKSRNISGMIKEIFPGFPIYPVDSIEGLEIKDKDLLVNATPVGLKEEDPCLLKDGQLHSSLFVYDLIYNPAQTKLLALAKQAGAGTSNGLGMLLYQGMLSFRIWTGQDAPREAMEGALNLELSVKKNYSKKEKQC